MAKQCTNCGEAITGDHICEPILYRQRCIVVKTCNDCGEAHDMLEQCQPTRAELKAAILHLQKRIKALEEWMPSDDWELKHTADGWIVAEMKDDVFFCTVCGAPIGSSDQECLFCQDPERKDE